MIIENWQRIINLYMKLYKSLLLSGIFILFSINIFAQNLKIEVYNKSGYDLDSLYIGKHYVGKIKKDSMVLVQGIKKLNMQSEWPTIPPRAKIAGKRVIFLLGCGTKARDVTTGRYKFDIISREDENRLRLYWKKHL
jgi:hypothetical protein